MRSLLVAFLVVGLAGCRATHSYVVRTPPYGQESVCVRQCERQINYRPDETDEYLQCLVACPDASVFEGECGERQPGQPRCRQMNVDRFSAGRTIVLVILLDVAATVVLYGLPSNWGR